MDSARYITDFADQAVLLPLAVVIGVAMLASGWQRGALAWTVVISAMLAVMLVLKIWAGACGEILFGDQLQSPSGHTASAASIYGGVIALMLRRTFRRVPLALVCAGVIALLVGATRVLIGAHSVLEVAIGAAVGVAAAVILEQTAGPVPSRLKMMPAVIAVLATVIIFHGLHLPAEAAIRKASVTWMPFGLCRAA
ncbi:phosphatase PAP2 family protein [Lichenifustis flavocetrariae]|uniref:Phosphatase PAP2 family protein n=1 Tax=Lichenifustis flavocetrariae TaxID=2949735 RepID=A0AA41Z3Q7_9HYPH|nr:phosphatase PAP2 family protein [Lichenifustis flavocetrariae]MCW6508712.1 phosphatase PAP2 family protein [Lichenifustis flavocetrariae]